MYKNNNINSKNKLFISSSCFSKPLLKNDINVNILKSIDGIEFTGGRQYYSTNKINFLFKTFNETHDILIHNYFPVPKHNFILNVASFDKKVIKNSFNLIKNAINLCKKYSIPYYSFHPGYLCDGYGLENGHFNFDRENINSYQDSFSNFINNMKHLYSYAKKKEINLVIENLYFIDKYDFSLNCTLDNIDETFSRLPNDVGFLLDLGHVNVTCSYLKINKEKFIDIILDKYNNKIREIHISCNDGSNDNHQVITKNDWQLSIIKEINKKLKDINFTYEARGLSELEIITSVSLIRDYIC